MKNEQEMSKCFVVANIISSKQKFNYSRKINKINGNFLYMYSCRVPSSEIQMQTKSQ